MNLRERRKTLADAVNSHDKEAIKSFLDPSFVAKDKHGKVVMNYWQILDQVTVLFKKHPEFKESVQIESIVIEGDTAKVITRRVDSMKVLWCFNWNEVSRWAETWKSIHGQWLIVEEQASPEQPTR